MGRKLLTNGALIWNWNAQLIDDREKTPSWADLDNDYTLAIRKHKVLFSLFLDKYILIYYLLNLTTLSTECSDNIIYHLPCCEFSLTIKYNNVVPPTHDICQLLPPSCHSLGNNCLCNILWRKAQRDYILKHVRIKYYKETVYAQDELWI